MTDFLDQLEHELDAAARRRGMRARRAPSIPAVAGAAAAAFAVALALVGLPQEREQPASDEPVRWDTRIAIISQSYEDPARAVAAMLQRAGYANRRASSIQSAGELESAVLYREGAKPTAADVAGQLGLGTTRPITAEDERRLESRGRDAQIVVTVGADLQQQLFTESDDCSEAGVLEAGVLSICRVDTPLSSMSAFVVEDGDERRVLPVANPAPFNQERTLGNGSWRWAAVSPDRKTILAQWSGPCEIPQAVLIPAEGGRPRQIPAEARVAPNSQAFGWTTDGRAIVFMAAQPGCGTELQPGLYLVTPSGRQTLVAPTEGKSPPPGLTPSLLPRTIDDIRQAIR